MGYVLNQYNKNKDTSSAPFMTYVTTGTPARKQTGSDSGVLGSTDLFENECVRIPASLLSSNNYYFHGKIKRMTSDQSFYIKLINYSAESETDNYEQYLKTITIAGGDPNDWVNVEFIFTPYKTFDTILFELQRTVEDYRTEVRWPIIIYEELSIINNMIPVIVQTGIEFIKIGVQSKPNLLMCINGEEIRTCRNGIYELKNSLILVSFFSVVAGGTETTNIIDTTITNINAAWEAAERIPDLDQREAAKAAIGSRCFFNSSKERTIDSFTLDYMYREE